MTRTKIGAAVLMGGLGASPILAATQLFPGEWEHHTTLRQAEVPGVPEWLVKMVAGHGSRKSCNSAAELTAHPESLFKADDDAICKLENLAITNGKLAFDTFFTNERFPQGLLVASRGIYTATSYDLATTSTGTKNSKPVQILTIETGKRVSADCKG